MNIWQRTLAAIRAYPSPQPVTWETVFGSGRYSPTGITVTEHSALHYSPVWSGVSTLSRDIAKLPLMFYKQLDNGGKEPFREHRLYRILKDEPNPEMTSFKFRETMQALCLLYGNAYAEIVRNDMGQVAGLYPILPSRVTPFRDDRSGRLRYRISNTNGSQTILAPENIIHLSSLSTDGVIGHSIVEHARESFELGLATERFGSTFFGNGSTFGGVVTYDAKLEKDQRADAQAAIEAIHQGVDRAHKVLVLGMGAKFTPRGTNPNEAQFLETRKFQINEVARWLTMPPHKLGDLENAHFTNIEEQEIQYYVGCVSGWLKMWEQELSRKLISRLEYAQQSIEHNLEGVLRGDSTKRADFYTKMFQIGAFSINRILQLENQNPIGPAGDQHLVPLNMVPIERYSEMIDAQIEAKQAKNEPPQLTEQSASDVANTDRRLEALQEEIRTAFSRAEEHATRAAAAQTEAAQSKEHAAEWRGVAEQEKAAAQTAQADAMAKLEALSQMTAERDAAIAQQRAETEQRAEAERLAAEAEETRKQAEAVAQNAVREAQEALERANAERDGAIAEKATESEQRAEAERRAEQAEALLVEARNEHAAKVREAQEAADQVALAVARAVAAEERGTASEQEKATIQHEIEAARAVLLERETALADAQRSLEAATEQAKAAEAKAAELEQQVQQFQMRRDAELDRLTRVVAAHRALITDVVHRLLRPEMDRARRRQATPESLRKWADAFYQTHRDVCADALYPVVLTHLAWKRSDEDPRAVAEHLATEHCTESEQQIRALIDRTEPEEFHGALERMLQRWEAERPGKVADVILTDEIQYIRSLA